MRRKERGYTAVELMLALGIFAVGVSGIIAMQKLTVVSNQHAKNLAIATNIAEAWMDQLAADATLWTHSGGISSTRWVSYASGTTDGNWQLPSWDADRKFGPGFDALGAPIDPTEASLDDARFCTHIRLTSLYGDSGGLDSFGRELLGGNGLARAEVRVFWLRDGAAPVPEACSQSTTVNSVNDAADSYHRVLKVGAVRQHGTAK